MPRLVITRRAGEAFFLRFPDRPEEVKITLATCQGRRGQLAIEAPATVAIEREELRQPRPKRPAA